MLIEAQESGLQTRTARMRYAMGRIGSTIVAGAVTTAGAGGIMFLGQGDFYTKMAFVMSYTILLSFIYTFGFFASCMLLFGPEFEEGIVRCPCCASRKKNDADKKRRNSTSPEDMDNSTFSDGGASPGGRSVRSAGGTVQHHVHEHHVHHYYHEGSPQKGVAKGSTTGSIGSNDVWMSTGSNDDGAITYEEYSRTTPRNANNASAMKKTPNSNNYRNPSAAAGQSNAGGGAFAGSPVIPDRDRRRVDDGNVEKVDTFSV